MDDSLAREIRELKARLDDAEAKSSAAEARWNAAEARRNTAEAKIDAAEAKASAAEAKLRPLNVDEYLIACHDLLQLSLTFPESKSQGTQGLTRVMGKFYPKTIQQDQTLARDHEKYIDLALKALRADRLDTRPHFPSTTEIEYDARALGKGLVACERDVEYWIIVAVQKHATNILASLSGEALQRRWEPHKKISFVNHQRHLQETTPFAPPMGRANPSPTDPKINSTSALMTRDLAADKLCVHYADESKEKSQRILFPIEYKPPHKVFADLLRRGLKLRSIKDEILDNVHAPTRSSRKRKHGEGGQRAPMSEAELNSLALEVVAMVLTQTYDKMVTARVEHGLLTTGESFVWLYVAKNDPTTLKWHLTVPGAVLPSSQNPLQFRETAVTQLVGWCLMVFDRFKGQHSQDWFQALKPKLAKWMYNDDDLLANIPETPTKAKKNSPYPPRKKHSKNTCGEKKLTARPHDDRDDGSPSKDKSPYPPAPQGSRQNPSRKTSAQQTRGSHQQTPPQSMEHAPYCTQACLQGLTQGLVMDTSCPNHALHLQQTSSPHHHPLTTSTLISLLYAQLKAHPDDGIYPQGIMGACGYLFKLALLSHGYVLVGKGTIPPSSPLLFEAKVYNYLTCLQGVAIPICLGIFKPFYEFLVGMGVDQISHFLLLSYGGEPVREQGEVYEPEVRELVDMLYDVGICHGDVMARNVLWNEREGKYVLIDFSHSRYIGVKKEKVEGRKGGKKKRKALQDKSPNKRIKQEEEEGGGKGKVQVGTMILRSRRVKGGA